MRPIPWIATAVTAAAVMCLPAPAAAQVVLGGGRVIIGPPVGMGSSGDTGQGNYPGGNGFVPGYGYYPYYGNDPDRPPVFGRFRKHTATPPGDTTSALETLAPPTGCAVLRLRVPGDAEVWFGDAATTQRGTERSFVTPPLEPGRAGYYDVRVRWHEAGRPVERTEVVPVFSGDRRTVDFLAPPGPERLPRMPRTAGGEAP